MDDDLRRRAELHAALGEPHRLAIVDELTTSDRSPRELAQTLGMATNLLAHHLDTLESVGLIERITSSGDRRRRYVRLRRHALDAVGPIGTERLGSALFVCTHNSARSQLAAALWTRHTGAQATSAGTHPADRVHPRAIAAARRAGLDLSGATPRLVSPGESADTVITVCDRAHEELDPPSSWWHWSIADPAEADDDSAFETALAQIQARISTVTDRIAR